MDFKTKLDKIVEKNNSLVSVGLDIDMEKMPKFLFKKFDDPYLEFNTQIISNTKDFVCAYKINMAFYEVFGMKGWQLLEKTIEKIPKDIIIILDGKRNDIGNTAKKYAYSLFETLKADAITITPYLGFDGIKPFLEYKDKCSFILCRTSNPSAVDFQNLQTPQGEVFQIVAEKIMQWNKEYKNCGMVIGATYPEELKMLRCMVGEDIPFLIPGVGAQGGDVQKTVEYGTNSKGKRAIINSSRGIIYSGKDEKFAETAGQKSEELKDQINLYR